MYLLNIPFLSSVIIYIMIDQGIIHKKYKEFLLKKQIWGSLPKFSLWTIIGSVLDQMPHRKQLGILFLPHHLYQISHNNLRLSRYAIYLSWLLVNYPPWRFFQPLPIPKTFFVASHLSITKVCLYFSILASLFPFYIKKYSLLAKLWQSLHVISQQPSVFSLLS